MDARLDTPWKVRIFQLRMAIRYLPPQFARVLGTNTGTLRRLEKGELEPNIQTIRRIRLMEHAFDEELEEYYKLCKRFKCKWTWGKEIKVYEKYGGYAFKRRAVSYANSKVVPRRKEDYEALGGMAVWGVIENPTKRNYKRRHIESE